MKNLYPRLTKAPVDAPVTYSHGIYQYCSPCADVPTRYTVSKNQNSRKWWMLPKLAAIIMLLVLSFCAVEKSKAQTPTVSNPWATIAANTFPRSFISDANQNLYTATTNAISKITAASTVTQYWAFISSTTPATLVIDASGTIYSVNANSTVSKVTASGTLTQNWVTLEAGSNPVDMVADANGNLFVCYLSKGLISKVTSAGVATNSWVDLGVGANTRSMLIAENGDIFVSTANPNKITKVTSAGVVTGSWAAMPANYEIFNMTFDANGNIYATVFTATGESRVCKIAPDGTVNSSFAILTGIPQSNKIICDNKRGFLYLLNEGTNSISKISMADGSLTQTWVTLGGTDKNIAGIIIGDNLYVSQQNAGTIVRIELPSVTFNQTQPTCANSTNGGLKAIPPATITCAGAIQYLWSPGGATTDTISNLAPGTYSVRVVCGTDTFNKSIVLSPSTVIPAPVTSNQSLCYGATVADLVATSLAGNTVQWYNTPTGGTQLSSSNVLVNGNKYYAAQTTATNCESGIRGVDSVTIFGAFRPINDTSFCNTNGTAAINITGGIAGNTYSWVATQNGTGIPASGNTTNINFTKSNNSNSVQKDTIMVSASYTSPITYAITDATYAFEDTTGSTYLNISTEYSSVLYSEFKPIGFNFNFFGNPYTQVRIGKEGSVKFAGGTGSSFATNDIVFHGQNRAWATDVSSKISYKLTGTAPNQKLVVTFIDLVKPADVSGIGFCGFNPMTGPITCPYTTSYSANPTNGRGTFQIVLNETTNAIASAKQTTPSLTRTTVPATSFAPPDGPVGNNYEGVVNGNTSKVMVANRDNGNWILLNNETKIFTPTTSLNCVGLKDTFFVTVNPTPKMDSLANVTICPSSTAAAINFTTPITGDTVGYKWTNNNTAIGLAASGFGNIPSFTAAATAQTSTISVTPYMLKSATDTCFGTIRTFTISAASPLPPPSITGHKRVVYTGAKTISQLAITPLAGGTLNFFYEDTGGTALPGSTPVVDDTTYYVSQTVDGCVGELRNEIKVKLIANDTIVFCNPDSVANLTATPRAGFIVRWYDVPSGGNALARSTPITAAQDTLYVEEAAYDGRYGVFIVTSNRVPVIVMVNPTATVTATTDKVVCNNSTVAAVNFSTTTPGGNVTYPWTNSKPSIGLAASGTGDIASFTAINNGTAPDTATIIVSPTIIMAGVSCAGVKDTFLIVVNPTANVNTISDQVVCNGASVSAINFGTTNTGGTVTYAWTNNTTSIGLAASGSGNIATFNGVNNGTSPITATITVTPTFTNGGVSCTGSSQTFTITVNPTANINALNDHVLCNGASFAEVAPTTTATGGTVTYAWTNNTTSIGLAASGTGNIPAFSSVNSGTAPVTATVIVTPTFANGGVNCTGTADTFYITVNPTAKIDTITNKVACNGTTVAAVTPTSTASGGTVTYAWTNNNTSIGLAASGTGTIPAFTAINTGTVPVTATITVTPTFTNNGLSCTGTVRTYTITINPTATVNTVSNQVVCNGSAATAVNFSTTATGGTVTYAWTNSNTTIGLSASGSGNIASFTAANSGTAPVTATITVTPTFTNAGVSCPGTAQTFTITVNPTAAVNAISNQAVCNGSSLAAINFGTTATGGTVTYAWTNSNSSIGLAASGTGNIASFNATNSSNAPITATITVTPTFANGGVSCTGTALNFTVTVNPTAVVNTVSNQVVCNAAAVTAINFSSNNTGGTITYAWTNNTTSIGLAASGNGNITTFNGVNTGTAPVTATIVVTPTFTNGGVSCAGTSQTFTITVNPTANINALNDHVLCNGANFTEVAPTTTATGGTVTYAWTNNTTSLGLAASGTGNIPAFTTVNNGTAPVTATVIVIPTFANGGVNCAGTADTFYITVNPTAKIDTITNKVACNGATVAAVTPTSTATGGTVTYAWTNNNTSIGLAASGTGTIPAFTAINTGTVPVTATITVTPTFTNNGLSCTGTVRTYTITFNPTATVNTVSNQVVCNGSAATAVNFSTTATGGTVTYAWTNSNTTIGLSASGSGNIASFTAANSGTAPVTATITVTPTFTNAGVSCQGTAQTFTITVNPTAAVNAVSNQTVCNGTAISAVNFSTTATGGTVTYAWTNSNSSIGLAASGTGNIASFNATNSSNAPITATITVTPTFANGGVSCTGTALSFTITINPTAVVNAVNNQTVCAGSTNSAVTFSSPVAGTTYSWTNSNPSIGLAASGTGNIPSFVAVNPSPNAINATITVTPNTPPGCVGQAITYTITVNGWSVAPSSINNPTPIVCANNAFTTLSVNGGALGSGAVWKWYADSLTTVSIGSGVTLANIPVAKTTTYFVRAEGTCNNTAAASVVVQRANLVHHVRQHWSDVLLFDNSSRNYVAWQWYKNGVAVPGATLQQYSESSALVGTYHVVATDRNGAQFISCPQTITATLFTGLRISLFPNPADIGSNVSIATSFNASELQGANIIVSDINGNVIRQITQVLTNNTMQAPTVRGMYVVTLTLQNGMKYSTNLLTK
jgi:hypothetical protein